MLSVGRWSLFFIYKLRGLETFKIICYGTVACNSITLQLIEYHITVAEGCVVVKIWCLKCRPRVTESHCIYYH